MFKITRLNKAGTTTLEKYSEELSIKKCKWIENKVLENIPSWKLKVIKTLNFSWLRKLLRANMVIEEHFPLKTILRLNGKIIGTYQITFKA